MIDYSLNNWLYRLGLWRGQDRELELKDLLFQDNIKLSRAGIDPNSGQLIDVFSEASYDPEDGIFEYKLGWWRYIPHSEGQANKQYVMSLKGRIADHADINDNNPQIIPEEILIGGQAVFNNTGTDSDPIYQGKYQAMMNIAWDMGSRVNNLIQNKDEPVSKIAQIFAGDDGKGNLSKQVFGTAPIFRGLDEKSGGFGDTPLQLAFANASMVKDKNIQFNNCDDEQLKSLMGFVFNNLDINNSHINNFKVPAVDPDSGVTFNTEVNFEIDAETKRRIFTLSIAPSDIPLGHIPPAPFELMRLEFSRPDEDTAVLEKSVFMQVPKNNATMFDVLRKIGYFQEANSKYLAKGKYPPLQDLAIKYRVENDIEEMPTPPSLKTAGGEIVVIPLNGCSMTKKGGLPTDGVGGGTLIMSRGLKDDGTISEVSVLHGMPLIPAPDNEDYEAIMADVTPWWQGVRYVVIDHDHFDHSTVEYYAQKGFFKTKEGEKPKEIICTKEVKYIIEQRLNNVADCLRPRFKVVNDIDNIPVKDEEGNTRIWIQSCKNGTRHSAQTSTQIFTGCYNDEKYLESYLFCNDSFSLSEKGKEFVKKGVRALGKEKGVTASKVDKEIDVAFYEPTAITFKGKTTTKDEFKETWRSVMEVLGNAEKASIFVPFSTNHEEYQYLIELFNEPHIMRNYTFVGRNAEIRGSSLNQFGVNPWIDLGKVKLPKKIMDKIMCPVDTIIAENAWDVDNKSQLKKAIDIRIAEIKIDLEAKGKHPAASTEIYILKSIFKNSKFKFDTSKNLEAYNMYQAIVENKFQDTSVMTAGRSSMTAKGFRSDPQHTAVITTGPSGTESEHFASISRYKNFWSLFDSNEKIASTGYYMDPEKSVICITQPAPPIKGAEEAQEQMIKDVIKNRNTTVIAAHRTGFKIYNPKELVNSFIEKLSDKKFEYKFDAVNNEITVYNCPSHIHGHGCREDVKEQINSVPARTHEVLHIPSPAHHKEFVEVVNELGKHTSIMDPDDHVMRKFEIDEKTGKPSMPIKAYLQQSFMTLRLFYQFGKPWRPLVEMKRCVVPRADGTTRRSGLAIRKGDGEFETKNAILDFNSAVNLDSNPDYEDYKARRNNPSKVEQKPEGQRPGGRMAFRNFGRAN